MNKLLLTGIYSRNVGNIIKRLVKLYMRTMDKGH